MAFYFTSIAGKRSTILLYNERSHYPGVIFLDQAASLKTNTCPQCLARASDDENWGGKKKKTGLKKDKGKCSRLLVQFLGILSLFFREKL